MQRNTEGKASKRNLLGAACGSLLLSLPVVESIDRVFLRLDFRFERQEARLGNDPKTCHHTSDSADLGEDFIAQPSFCTKRQSLFMDRSVRWKAEDSSSTQLCCTCRIDAQATRPGLQVLLLLCLSLS